MRKQLITALAGIALVSAAFAQHVPAPYLVEIKPDETVAFWDVPALQNGVLLSAQMFNTSGKTLAIAHLSRVSSTVVLTNAIETAAAEATLHCYPSQFWPTQHFGTNDVVLSYSPPKPVYLAPGDRLRFTLSATNSLGTAGIQIRTSVFGN